MTRSAHTRQSLNPVDDNVLRAPQSTPGTKMRQLKSELESKQTENESLRSNVNDLTKALEKIELVKTDMMSVAPSEAENSKKKKRNCPVAPAKTAYKMWLESQRKKEGVNMQQLWKEQPEAIREPYAALAKADKARFQKEMALYDQEQKALEMYREKKKQEEAMAFYEAHLAAQAALEKAQLETGKKKKAAKDPDAPKRCMSSYMFYSQSMRDSVKAKNPDAKVTEISKILGDMWKSLDKKKAKKYEDMAAADRKRYANEKADYDALLEERKQEAEREKEVQLEQEKKEAMELLESQSLQFQQIQVNAGNSHDNMSVISDMTGTKAVQKKKKDPNAPKRALTAYNYFMSENRDSIKAKMPENTTNAELLTEIGKQWKALTDKKKEKYTKKSTKDQARYAKEMEQYKANQENSV